MNESSTNKNTGLSLSRLLSKMEDHDTGTITAFRGDTTRNDNEAQNRLLARDLLSEGYRFTEVAGTFIENYNTPNAREVKENSFFVEDYRDTGNLRSDLIKLAMKYKQDSVLFIPRLGTASEKASLIGTSTDPKSYPGFARIVTFTGPGFGSPAEFMTKISGRPFTFSGRVIGEYANPMTMMGKWAKSEIERRAARDKLNPVSPLSLLWKHNLSHDCGAVSAFRPASDCGTGIPYSREDNLKRSTSLSAKLRMIGYEITATVGVYEGQKEVSFFVVDLENSGKLEADLRDLGEEFEQDSILFIPQGAINKEATAYLIGTSRCPDVEITYGKRVPFQRGILGITSPIYSTHVNGSPIFFESIARENIYRPTGIGF